MRFFAFRYRYNEASRTRMKTVEIVVERKEWTPPAPRFAADELVPVRIAYLKSACKRMAREAGGRWDPEARLWSIPYGRIKGTVLEKHIILDASKRGAKKKSI
jgi:hypothetical protein